MESSKKLCRAFNLTISTREDLTPNDIKYVVDWCRKCKYCCIVTERRPSDQVLHLHAALFFERNQDPRSIHDTLWKRIKLTHPTSLGRVACQVQAAPGDKWTDWYLTKDPASICAGSTLPLLPDGSVCHETLKEYFPSQEVQDILQKKAQARKDSKDALDYWKKLSTQYSRWLEDQPMDILQLNDPPNETFPTRCSTTQRAHTFLKYINNISQTIAIPRDRRKVFETALNLHEFFSESCELTAEEKRKHLTEHGKYEFDGRRNV